MMPTTHAAQILVSLIVIVAVAIMGVCVAYYCGYCLGYSAAKQDDQTREEG